MKQSTLKGLNTSKENKAFMFNKIPNILITLISIVVILIYSQNLLIPFIFALLLWFLIRKMKSTLDKIHFIKNKFPSWLKSIIVSVFIFSILGFVSNALSSSIATLANSYPKYESNVAVITSMINSTFNINVMDQLQSQFSNFNFGIILQLVFNSLSSILSNAFVILLYTLFIFLEEAHFSTKLRAVFPHENQYLKITHTIEKIEKSIADYIGLKTLVSLTSGILSYIVLLIIGIDSPVFWASLISLMNFIPTIGPLVGTAFPALFSLLQFGEFAPGIMVLVFIGLIQLLVGNILEPKLMGRSLNISSLITIMSLFFWGAIWGITGMIVSIPITVIMVIIFSQFEKTKSIAIILSAKGSI